MKYSEKKRRATAKILAIVLIAAMLLTSGYYILMIFAKNTPLSATAVYGADAQTDDPAYMDRLDGLPDFVEYIHTYYKDEVTYQSLVDAAYKGVVDSLGDTWSVYYNDKALSTSFVQDINQEYCGVGITMTLDSEGCLIQEVNTKGPAYEAGIRAGSYLTFVDGKSVKDKTLGEISAAVRGPEGTTVRLLVKTNGVSKTYDLVRRTLRVASVEYSMVTDKIGYINITSFSDKTDSELREARLMLVAKGADSLILDLRDNGGGYVGTAIEMANDFIDEGVLCRTKAKGQDLFVYEATNKGFRKMPVVILVNEGTASASEIFAAAMQDNGAAKLVGTKTYGKGVAQVIQEMDNDDSLKLSIYYFETPKGSTVNGVGITPDYIVTDQVFTAEQAAEIKASVVPMAEQKKYYRGDYGLNVLAAQQRLAYLGYDVEPTCCMDEKTFNAIVAFQPTFGGIPYGGLDFCTEKAICEAFDALFTRTDSDPQLAKAIELLSK